MRACRGAQQGVRRLSPIYVIDPGQSAPGASVAFDGRSARRSSARPTASGIADTANRRTNCRPSTTACTDPPARADGGHSAPVIRGDAMTAGYRNQLRPLALATWRRSAPRARPMAARPAGLAGPSSRSPGILLLRGRRGGEVAGFPAGPPARRRIRRPWNVAVLDAVADRPRGPALWPRPPGRRVRPRRARTRPARSHPGAVGSSRSGRFSPRPASACRRGWCSSARPKRELLSSRPETTTWRSAMTRVRIPPPSNCWTSSTPSPTTATPAGMTPKPCRATASRCAR